MVTKICAQINIVTFRLHIIIITTDTVYCHLSAT